MVLDASWDDQDDGVSNTILGLLCPDLTKFLEWALSLVHIFYIL